MKLITYIILTVFILGCGNKKLQPSSKTTIETVKYIDHMIQSKMYDFKLRAPNTYKEIDYFQRSLALVQKSDSLIDKIQTNAIKVSDMNDFKAYVEIFNQKRFNYGETDFIKDIERIEVKTMNQSEAYRDEVLIKIKTIELMLIETQHDHFVGTYMEIDHLATIYDAKSDKIKLGETYEAKIFLAGDNTKKPFIYMVDNDTIQIGTDKGFPKFTFKPDSKGKKTHKGCVINQQYGFKYEFDIEYTVE